MSKRCIFSTEMSLATKEGNGEENLDRLVDVLGAKGVLLFLALLAAVFVAWAAPGVASEPVAGALLALALGGAVALDRELSDDDTTDTVGVSVFVLAVLYTTATALELGVGWLSALGASLVVAMATAYEYHRDEGGAGVDVVGVLAAGALAFYAALRATGWTEFAHSPVFAGLVFFVGTGFVAVFFRRATVEPDDRGTTQEQDDELYRLLFGVVNEVADVSDEAVRQDIASKMRLVAGRLGGVKLPTVVKDRHGGVPVVLPDDAPDTREESVTVEEVVDTADRDRFTGYVLHGDAVLFFRNGTPFKHYNNGEYGHDIETMDTGVGTQTADSAFFSLGHMPLNDLDDLTPTDEKVVTPEEARKEARSETEDGDGKTLRVGGDEIDIEEMFEKADEVLEDVND